MSVVALVALPAAFAAVVAILGTLAVERFGGALGGILHTVPTTIVPAALGMWQATHDPTAFSAAMAAVPLGMLVDAGFLWVWRAVPRRLQRLSLGAALAVMIPLSLAVWGVGAYTLSRALVLVPPARDPRWFGAVGLMALGIVGLLSCVFGHPTPKGTHRPAPWVLAARGLLAATAIAVCVWIAHAGAPTAAGLASAFPAMFLTTMVSLSIAQGQAVPTGAVGPMILGSTSVGTFALLASWSMPALGAWPGVFVAWVFATAVTSVPAALWLRRRAANVAP